MQSLQKNPQVILELAVRNHPGVMTHVCGLLQMISQVEKLEDVLQVKRHNEDMRVFEQLEAFFQ